MAGEVIQIPGREVSCHPITDKKIKTILLPFLSTDHYVYIIAMVMKQPTMFFFQTSSTDSMRNELMQLASVRTNQ